MTKTTEERITYLEGLAKAIPKNVEHSSSDTYFYSSSSPVKTSFILQDEAMLGSMQSRIKRILETPLGSRVMLPNFGSNLFELVDKVIDEEYKIRFIAYTHEAFYDLENGKLWDKDLEPKQVLFNSVDDAELKTTLILTTGEELNYGN